MVKNMSQKKHTSIGLYVLIGAILSLALFIQVSVEGQFFTKSNSKSIPRMGRRSDPMVAQSSGMAADLALRRQLLTSLLARLGPNAIVVSRKNAISIDLESKT